jgi:hypothetical protein
MRGSVCLPAKSIRQYIAGSDLPDRSNVLSIQKGGNRKKYPLLVKRKKFLLFNTSENKLEERR